MKISFILILALFINLSLSKISKDKWVKDLISLANQPSKYSQEYGKNALLWDGERWWCDCSNLQKALFNGRDITDKTVGKFEKNTENTGDVNANGLIQLCKYISSDFSKLQPGEPRLIHMGGHIGAYIGKEINTEHGVCNVVECTSRWNEGVQFSYVDAKGNRLYGKGGNNGGKWTKHGLPSDWVSY